MFSSMLTASRPFVCKTSSSSLSSTSSSMTMSWRRSQFGLFVWILALTTLAIYYGSTTSEAYPVNMMMARKYPVNVEVENPEELISTLDNLIQNILVGIDSSHSSNFNNEKSSGTSKRGIDLGLSRGFSGSQAAKHLMGMSAASFANGPGRRR